MSDTESPSTYVEVNVCPADEDCITLLAAFDRIADALHLMPLPFFADLAADLSTETLTFCITFNGGIEPETALQNSLHVVYRAIEDAGFDPTAWEVARALVELHGNRKPHLEMV